MEIQRCRIYTGAGELQSTRTFALECITVSRAPTIADHVPVTAIMTRDIVCGRAELSIKAVKDLLVDNHIGCVPIVDERGRPKGIITKLDIVERTEPALTAGEVMMPLAITLNTNASIAHAAAMMATEDFHHVMVVGPDHVLVGVVSTMDIVRWLARNDGFTGG